MMIRHVYLLALPALLLSTSVSSVSAQDNEKIPHIGYVFPAGGTVDSSVTVAIGGQYLDGTNAVRISGEGVTAEVISHYKSLSENEARKIRDQVNEVREKVRTARANGVSVGQGGGDALFWKFAEEIGLTKEKYEALQEYERRRNDPKRQLNPQLAELITLKLTIDANAPLGKRDLRLVTAGGLTNPVWFYVGELKEYVEKEPNDIQPDSGWKEPLPVVFNGQIMPGDVDRLRFHARRGDGIVVEVKARDLVPYLADAVPGWFQATVALYNAQGRELVYMDDFLFHPDPVFFYRIPTTGDYVVEIHDSIYRGREDFVYRITVGELPFITSLFPLGGQAGQSHQVTLNGWNLIEKTVEVTAGPEAPQRIPVVTSFHGYHSNQAWFEVDDLTAVMEQEPNNSKEEAQPLKPPLYVDGRIDQPGDWDVYSFQGRKGGHVVVEVLARRLNSPVDSWIAVTDAQGKQIAVNDDYEDKAYGLVTHHADSRVTVELPETGTYYVHLGDTQDNGGPTYGYRLRVSGRRPDFDLRIVPSSLRADPGTTVPLTVYALRRDDFAGDIQLVMRDGLSGFHLGGAWLPAGADQTQVTLTIPTDPPGKLMSLHLEGIAKVKNGEIRRPVVPADDMMQAFIYHHLVPTDELLLSLTDKKAKSKYVPPFTSERRELAAEFFRDEPLKLTVGTNLDLVIPTTGRWNLNQVMLELVEPPPGVAVEAIYPEDGRAKVVIRVDQEQAKHGTKGNLLLRLFSRQGGAAGAPLVTLPAIPFEIVDPAALLEEVF